MIALVWPLVFFFTLSLYALILLTLPFSATTATVFLFALIAFWSRLPGSGIPHPLYILYLADVIDIIAVIVAVNVGGIYAGILSLFANFGGRLCGVFPAWGPVISDAISMFLACLLIPFVHGMFGGSLIISVIAFQVIRLILIIPLDQIFYRIPFPKYIVEMVGGGAILILINVIYTKFFGEFFDSLLASGISFNWPLFIGVTIVIVGFYLSVYGKSKNLQMPNIIRLLKETKKKKPRTDNQQDMSFIRDSARR